MQQRDDDQFAERTGRAEAVSGGPVGGRVTGAQAGTGRERASLGERVPVGGVGALQMGGCAGSTPESASGARRLETRRAPASGVEPWL